MSVVVDVNVSRLPAILEAVEIDALLVVLAHVIADDRVAVMLLHDSTEPHVVVAVVVLDKGIYAIPVGVKSPSVLASPAHVSIGLVVLDLGAITMETKDTVSRTVSAAVGQGVVLINGILTGTGNDTIASGMVYVVVCHVNLGPQIVADRVVLSKFNTSTGRIGANAHAPDSDNLVIRDAEIMNDRGF